MVSHSVPSALTAVYDDRRVRDAFPMADAIRDGLRSGAPRPVVPSYLEASQALQNAFWPPGQVDPRSTPRAAQRAVAAALR
jgi:multiple sugar transport system substrate-binding protein